MARPTFTTSISLGNVLTLVALMAAGVAAFSTMQGQVNVNQKAIEAIKVEAIAARSRLRAVELDTARSEERLTSIHSLLSRIDARLERIERQSP